MRKSGLQILIFNIFRLQIQIDDRFEIALQKIFFPADILLSISALIFAAI